MYWCKPVLYSLLTIFILSGLQSCKPDKNASKDDHEFFSLKKFFVGDSARMAKTNPLVTKTVSHNQDTQTKKVHIQNWGDEFSLFSGSDINRPAWKAEYKVHESDSLTTYTAADSDLRTRQITIKKVAGKVISIAIYNHTQNMLYESNENLLYYPDSLYEISKWQHVKLLGTNVYKIKGELK